MNTRTKSLSNLNEFSLDEFRKIIREEVISATDSQFKQLLDDEKLRKIIRKETTDAIQAEIGERLQNLESAVNGLRDIQDTVKGLETSQDFISGRLDDLEKTALPSLALHVENVATQLALQTLDVDMHRRKWNLTIQGLKGPADEDETDTRRACVDLAKSHMGIPDASAFDFSACHRLSRKENAGIIVRFKDLQQRNEWLANAKSLKSHTDKVSIAADLPPVLRPLKKELLQKRKDLPAEQKRGSIVRNLKQWPYVELKILNGPVIKPSARAADIVNTVLGFNALWRLS